MRFDRIRNAIAISTTVALATWSLVAGRESNEQPAQLDVVIEISAPPQMAVPLRLPEPSVANAPRLQDPQNPRQVAEDVSVPPKKPQTSQPNLTDMDLEQLSKLQVRPAATSATTAQSGTGSSTTITPSQLDQAQQSSTGQLLDRAPSVSLRRISSLSLDPRIRGYHAGQLNASADGATQLRTRLDIDSLFSQIDPGNVESVTVIDGPYTSLYGPGFAFLNVELVQPRRYANGDEAHFSSLFSYGYNGAPLYTRERVWGGGKDYGFDVSYGLRSGNDYRSGNFADPRVPASYNQQDVRAALSFDLSPISRLELDYLRLHLHNVELPGVAYDINNSVTDQFNIRWIIQDRDDTRRFVLQFWGQRTPFDGDASRESKRITFTDKLIGNSNPGLLGGNLVNEGYLASLGARALATFGGKNAPQVTIGADWRRYEQYYRERNLAADGSLFFGGDVFGIPRSHLDDFGVLIHGEVPINDAFQATAGGRLDITRPTVNGDDVVARQAPGDPTGFYRPGLAEPTDLLGMSYLSTQYRATDWLRLTSGVAFAMRPANLTERYADEPYTPVNRFGNSFADGDSQLRPEKNLQFDIGAAADWQRVKLGARAFQATVYDYILAVPADAVNNFVPVGVNAPIQPTRNLSAFGFDPADPTVNTAAATHSVGYRYRNIDRASFFGGELTGDVVANSWITIGSSLAYVRGLNHSPQRYEDATNQFVPIKGAESLPNIYPFSGSVRVRVTEPCCQRWGIELIGRFVLGQDQVAESLGELPTPGFTIFDLHGFYRLSDHWRIFGSAQNLFDRYYTEHGSLVISDRLGSGLLFVPEKGFNLTLGVEAQY